MNALKTQQDIDRFAAQWKARLDEVSSKPYIVFHDAYQYFEKAFGMNAVGSITIDPERRPGARRIKELRTKIADLKVVCLFKEKQFSGQKLIDTLMENDNVKVGILDPIGSRIPNGPKAWFVMMRANAQSLLGCLR